MQTTQEWLNEWGLDLKVCPDCKEDVNAESNCCTSIQTYLNWLEMAKDVAKDVAGRCLVHMTEREALEILWKGIEEFSDSLEGKDDQPWEFALLDAEDTVIRAAGYMVKECCSISYLEPSDQRQPMED